MLSDIGNDDLLTLIDAVQTAIRHTRQLVEHPGHVPDDSAAAHAGLLRDLARYEALRDALAQEWTRRSKL